MRITIEERIDPASIAGFYELYATAFEPLRTRAAARHLLTAEEFAAEMADNRIEKYVVWEGDEPIAITTLARDLSAVPWISAEYFAARYPEQMARGAVLYLGYALVRPDRERQGVLALTLARMARRCNEERAVCAFDVCGYNDDVHAIGRSIARLSRSYDMSTEAVDVQTYYTACFTGRRAAQASDVAKAERAAVA